MAERRERASRLASFAKLGVGVAGQVALNRALSIFASAERKVELDRRTEISSATQVAEKLGQMKGVMAKLGQMLSYVDVGVSDSFSSNLEPLWDSLPPMTRELTSTVIEESLGAKPEKIFKFWDPEPIAAASIGQVHRALTRDNQAVAVKVQYPGIRETVAADLSNVKTLSRVMSVAFPSMETNKIAEELRVRLLEELDYRLEARNQELFHGFYKGHPFITVPAVIPSLSTDRILVSELAEGVRFAEITEWDEEQKSDAAETIFRFVFRSLYQLNAFNGDPHPGNYLFNSDGRVVFLDFGLVKRFSKAEMDTFESMIRAMVIDRNPNAFREAICDAGLIPRDAPITDAQIRDHFEGFYATVMEDAPFKMTREYSQQLIKHTFDTSSPLARYVDVPDPFVIIQRINLGLYALMARLGAVRNWRRIAAEIWPFTQGPPATRLGELEHSWLESRQGR